MLLLLVAGIWGLNYAAMKFLLAELSPLTIVYARFPPGSALLFLLLFFVEDVKIQRGDLPRFFLLGATGVSVYQFFFIYGMRFTSATNAAILLSTAPIFGTLVSGLARYERLTVRQVAGTAIGFIGVFVTISRGHLAWTGGSLQGDLLILGASVLWALYTVLARPLFARYSPLKVTTYAMAVGSLMLVPFAPFLFNAAELTLLSLPGWGWLIFATVLAFVVAFYLFYRGVASMGAPKAMLYLYMVPLFAAFFAYWLLHEGLSPAQGAGALIVFLAIATVRG